MMHPQERMSNILSHYLSDIEISKNEIPLKIDLDQIDGWYSLNMTYALNGASMTLCEFCLLLTISIKSQKTFKYVLEAIKSNSVPSEFIQLPQTSAFVNQLRYSNGYFDKTSYIFFTNLFQLKVFDKFPSDYSIYIDEKVLKKRVFSLLAAMSKKYPLTIVQVFNHDKESLVLNDKEFTRFVYCLVNAKSKENKLFSQILKAMESDKRRILKTGMFLQ